jgi:hypothetical protein
METFDRPLSDFDARQLTNKISSRCAIREILYRATKSEFGDSLVKLLFFESNGCGKMKIRELFLRYEFFSSAGRLASDRLTAPLHKPARTSCRKRL